MKNILAADDSADGEQAIEQLKTNPISLAPETGGIGWGNGHQSFY